MGTKKKNRVSVMLAKSLQHPSKQQQDGGHLNGANLIPEDRYHHREGTFLGFQ